MKQASLCSYVSRFVCFSVDGGTINPIALDGFIPIGSRELSFSLLLSLSLK